MKLTNNFLSNLFDWLGEAFEKFNPSAFRFLGAALPYLTPLPVAWLTSQRAEEFLGFTPGIAFVFVFSLEGIGLWFTSMLVDSVVDWIRSKNWKSASIVAVLGVAVISYVWLLVSLNVLLESTSAEATSVYKQVVTLLCFLPLISGIGNGYYKLKLKADTVSEEAQQYSRKVAEQERQDKKEARLQSKLIKAGFDPRQVAQTQVMQSTVAQVQMKGDWRLLSEREKNEVRNNLSVPEIMERYGVGRSTAFEWKKK